LITSKKTELEILICFKKLTFLLGLFIGLIEQSLFNNLNPF